MIPCLDSGDKTNDPGKIDNAALKYHQAFALVPRLDEERMKIVSDGDKAKLDASVKKLLDESQGALTALRRGASIRRCDWGLDLQDGPHLLMPHLAKSRELAKLALLRARWNFEKRDFKAGLADAGAVLALARHVGAEGALVGLLVQLSLENAALDTLAGYLPRFDEPARKQLRALIDDLPRGGTFRSSILVEKEYMVGYTMKEVKAGTYGLDGVEAIVRGAGGPAGPIKHLEELASHYDEMARIVSLPSAEFAPKWDAIFKKLDGNPFAKMLLPALNNVHEADKRSRVRWAMFRAGLAAAESGTDKLKDSDDPAGAGPFTFSTFDGGFELKSKMLVRGEPVLMTFGRRGE
jgi:hypothetical protein